MLYDYWFNQFEFPNEEGKPYKSSGGEIEVNTTDNSKLPKGWKSVHIQELILADKGGDWGQEECTGNYIHNVYCVRGADFPSSIGKTTINAPKRWILEKNTTKEIEYGDILIEISGGSPTQSTGRICYANFNYLRRFDKPVITSNFCKAISLKDPSLYGWFYLMWAKLYESGAFFNFEGKTTGLKNLLFDAAINNYMVNVAPKHLMTKFCDIINPMFEEIQHNALENQKLEQLRDHLLPLLMNGQISVK